MAGTAPPPAPPPASMSPQQTIAERGFWGRLVLATGVDHLPKGYPLVFPIAAGGPRFTIGRASSNNLVLDFPIVSSAHANIYLTTANEPYLQDTSMNGTEVQNTKVAKGDCVKLSSGSSISISVKKDPITSEMHKVSFIFHIGSRPIPRTLGLRSDDPIFLSYDLTETELGRGNFGVVYLGFSIRKQEWVAVKLIDSSRTDPATLNREVNILMKVHHENLMSALDFFQSPNKACLVFEKADGGDLCSFIQQRGHLTEHQSFHFFSQIVEGLDALHKENIIHRDLKPENVLLRAREEYPAAKITDFGLARTLDAGSLAARTRVGTLQYVAPEILLLGSGVTTQYGYEVDLWSLGAMLFVMVTGSFPFNGADENITETLILAGNYSWEGKPAVSAEVMDLIRRLLDPNPTTRITLDMLRQHPWFAGFRRAFANNHPATVPQSQGRGDVSMWG
ncbi:myosin light chain kinase A [Pelomyxa schiedti]|nr:myosin light chain kinase A [Pelomyxa schiedti]